MVCFIFLLKGFWANTRGVFDLCFGLVGLMIWWYVLCFCLPVIKFAGRLFTAVSFVGAIVLPFSLCFLVWCVSGVPFFSVIFGVFVCRLILPVVWKYSAGLSGLVAAGDVSRECDACGEARGPIGRPRAGHPETGSGRAFVLGHENVLLCWAIGFGCLGVFVLFLFLFIEFSVLFYKHFFFASLLERSFFETWSLGVWCLDRNLTLFIYIFIIYVFFKVLDLCFFLLKVYHTLSSVFFSWSIPHAYSPAETRWSQMAVSELTKAEPGEWGQRWCVAECFFWLLFAFSLWYYFGDCLAICRRSARHDSYSAEVRTRFDSHRFQASMENTWKTTRRRNRQLAATTGAAK